MIPSNSCLIKNKITEAFIYDSQENYIMPQKYEKYKTSDMENLFFKENSSNNETSNPSNANNTQSIINSSNTFNANTSALNSSQGNYKAEKKVLLREIDNIIHELEYFKKERRKNQMIEIMKSIVRNVDENTIPEPEDLLDFYFFGKSEQDILEDYLANNIVEKQTQMLNNQSSNTLKSCFSSKNADINPLEEISVCPSDLSNHYFLGKKTKKRKFNHSLNTKLRNRPNTSGDEQSEENKDDIKILKLNQYKNTNNEAEADTIAANARLSISNITNNNHTFQNSGNSRNNSFNNKEKKTKNSNEVGSNVKKYFSISSDKKKKNVNADHNYMNHTINNSIGDKV